MSWRRRDAGVYQMRPFGVETERRPWRMLWLNPEARSASSDLAARVAPWRTGS
jgi:hypothetical protein